MSIRTSLKTAVPPDRSAARVAGIAFLVSFFSFLHYLQRGDLLDRLAIAALADHDALPADQIEADRIEAARRKRIPHKSTGRK